ncbi:unnamed protein product [Microthlaspi erraticum]|uniref:Uncharacterized protein n=1 Tax=Microthlaspi erraticum TaxID=1685480 RepID=A0A6D2J4F7_9BRAS|nr:unnamed protein product [Microthlaspi erraticum]
MRHLCHSCDFEMLLAAKPNWFDYEVRFTLAGGHILRRPDDEPISSTSRRYGRGKSKQSNQRDIPKPWD